MNKQERIAIVTGGAGGIGQAVARQLITEGACVMLTDIDQEALDGAYLDLVKGGGEDAIGTVRANITSEADVEAILAATALRFGGVDLLGVELAAGEVAPDAVQAELLGAAQEGPDDLVEREHRDIDLRHHLAQQRRRLERVQALMAQGLDQGVDLRHDLAKGVAATRAARQCVMRIARIANSYNAYRGTISISIDTASGGVRTAAIAAEATTA